MPYVYDKSGRKVWVEDTRKYLSKSDGSGDKYDRQGQRIDYTPEKNMTRSDVYDPYSSGIQSGYKTVAYDDPRAVASRTYDLYNRPSGDYYTGSNRITGTESLMRAYDPDEFQQLKSMYDAGVRFRPGSMEDHKLTQWANYDAWAARQGISSPKTSPQAQNAPLVAQQNDPMGPMQPPAGEPSVTITPEEVAGGDYTKFGAEYGQEFMGAIQKGFEELAHAMGRNRSRGSRRFGMERKYPDSGESWFGNVDKVKPLEMPQTSNPGTLI